MGAGNVRLVFGDWSDLPHAPFRVLMFMALMSRDIDTPPLFWGGREVLARAMGRMVSEATDDERNATFRIVRRSTTMLAKRGAISVETRAAPGRNTVYALHLNHRGGAR